MCTVSFFPIADGFVLTSTRDEVVHRETFSPAFYEVAGHHLIFPKDKKSNGTWIASDGEKLSVCLLNGAWSNHQKQPNYKMSRGLVPLKVFEFLSFEAFVKSFDFEGIEPFTLIGVQEGSKTTQLFELRWDGESTSFAQLNEKEPHLWSSYTLYPPFVQEKRNTLFKAFLKELNFNSLEKIQKFHLQKDIQDPDSSLLRYHHSGPKSVSLTQLVRNCSALDLIYFDLLANTESHLSIKSPICV